MKMKQLIHCINVFILLCCWASCTMQTDEARVEGLKFVLKAIKLTMFPEPNQQVVKPNEIQPLEVRENNEKHEFGIIEQHGEIHFVQGEEVSSKNELLKEIKYGLDLLEFKDAKELKENAQKLPKIIKNISKYHNDQIVEEFQSMYSILKFSNDEELELDKMFDHILMEVKKFIENNWLKIENRRILGNFMLFSCYYANMKNLIERIIIVNGENILENISQNYKEAKMDVKGKGIQKSSFDEKLEQELFGNTENVKNLLKWLNFAIYALKRKIAKNANANTCSGRLLDIYACGQVKSTYFWMKTVEKFHKECIYSGFDILKN